LHRQPFTEGFRRRARRPIGNRGNLPAETTVPEPPAILAAIALLAALPARADATSTLPLPLRRTPAVTQRPLELGIVAGLDQLVGPAPLETLPIALELGIPGGLELRGSVLLWATGDLGDERFTSVGDRMPDVALLGAWSAGLGATLLRSDRLALALAVDGAWLSSDRTQWSLTPSLHGATLAGPLVLEANAAVAAVRRPSGGWIRPAGGLGATLDAARISSFDVLASATATWVLGDVLAGLRVTAIRARIDAPALSGYSLLGFPAPAESPALLRVEPRLGLLAGRRFRADVGLPIDVRTFSPGIVVGVRVDEPLGGDPP
jgi:hypothetical protein